MGVPGTTWLLNGVNKRVQFVKTEGVFDLFLNHFESV